MQRMLFIFLLFGFGLGGCSISSHFEVDDADPVLRSSGPPLSVTKPALCNDYPVEYRRGGAGTESTMANVDIWFLARKPNPCRKQPKVEEASEQKRPFWRFWK